MLCGHVHLYFRFDSPAVRGLLADGRRSAAAISQTLSQLLGTGVRLESMVGRWLAIDQDQHNRLGKANSRLGVDSLIGRRWFDTQAAIALHIDAQPWSWVCDLLPGGGHHEMLRKLLRLLTERRVDVFVVFKVISESAPSIRLSQNRQACAPKLGYTAVIGKQFSDQPTRTIRVFMPAFDSGASA